jgi:D-Tyr-tRNAtyr deacylase
MNEYIIEYSTILGIFQMTIYANCKKEARDKFWSACEVLCTPVNFIKWVKK